MEKIILLIVLLQVTANLALTLVILREKWAIGLPDPKTLSRHIREALTRKEAKNDDDFGVVDVLDVEMESLDRSGLKEVDELMASQLKDDGYFPDETPYR